MLSSAEVHNRPASAIADLESYVASHPGNAAAHFRLGQVYHEARDRQSALKHFVEAANLDPQDLNFRKMLADFQYVELGDLESAITNYVRILDQDPRNVENLTILGNISLSMSRFAEARTFFSTVARLEPWNGEVQKILEAIARKQVGGSPAPTYQSARELAECGRTVDAIRALESIVSADPRHFLAHNDLGVLYGSQGNAELALEHALAAVQGEPDDIVARKNLGDLYHSVLQQPEEAMRHYLEVLRRAPADIETLLAIGSVCVGLDRTEEARSFFSMVLSHQPGHELAREMLGRLEPVPGPECTPTNCRRCSAIRRSTASSGRRRSTRESISPTSFGRNPGTAPPGADSTGLWRRDPQIPRRGSAVCGGGAIRGARRCRHRHTPPGGDPEGGSVVRGGAQ